MTAATGIQAVPPTGTNDAAHRQQIAVALNALIKQVRAVDEPLLSTALQRTGGSMTGALNFAQGADIPAAATLNLDGVAGNFVNVTGSTGVTAITLAAGHSRKVRFTGSPTFTAGASLVLLNFTSFSFVPGDTAEFVGATGGVVYMVNVCRANGLAPFSIWNFGAFTSAQQTITSAGALTIAHGLGTTPTLLQARLHCVTAEAGYAIADEIIISPQVMDAISLRNSGISLTCDATNLNVRFGASAAVFTALNKTTGVGAALTNANWRLILLAWA